MATFLLLIVHTKIGLCGRLWDLDDVLVTERSVEEDEVAASSYHVGYSLIISHSMLRPHSKYLILLMNNNTYVFVICAHLGGSFLLLCA